MFDFSNLWDDHCSNRDNILQIWAFGPNTTIFHSFLCYLCFKISHFFSTHIFRSTIIDQPNFGFCDFDNSAFWTLEVFIFYQCSGPCNFNVSALPQCKGSSPIGFRKEFVGSIRLCKGYKCIL